MVLGKRKAESDDKELADKIKGMVPLPGGGTSVAVCWFGLRICRLITFSALWDPETNGWEMLGDNDEWKQFADYWSQMNFDTTLKRSYIPLAYNHNGEINPKDRIPLATDGNRGFMVRECYRDLYGLVSRIWPPSANGDIPDAVILLGQPDVGVSSLWLPVRRQFDSLIYVTRTGKTISLAFILVCLLSKGSVINNDDSSSCAAAAAVAHHHINHTYLFLKGSVYRRKVSKDSLPPRFPEDMSTCCLIDLGKYTELNDVNFMIGKGHPTFPIVASSPRMTRYKPIQTDRITLVEYMPLWTKEELQTGYGAKYIFGATCILTSSRLRLQKRYFSFNLTLLKVLGLPSRSDSDTSSQESGAREERIRSVLQTIQEENGDGYIVQEEDVEHKMVDDAIGLYGSAARDVFKAIFYPLVMDEEIKEVLRTLKHEELTSSLQQAEEGSNDTYTRHSIFEMVTQRRIGDHGPGPPPYETRFKSSWVASMVLKRFNFFQDHQTRLLSSLLSTSSYSKSVVGWLYEAYAIRVLSSGQTPSLSALVPKGTTSPRGIPSPFQEQRTTSFAEFTRNDLIFYGEDGKQLDPEDSLSTFFWVPIVKNDPLFDAFFVVYDNSSGTVQPIIWVLQMTIRDSHSGSEKGYKQIRMINKKAEERAKSNRRYHGQSVNAAEVKYVLVGSKDCDWSMPEKQRVPGDMYYQNLAV